MNPTRLSFYWVTTGIVVIMFLGCKKDNNGVTEIVWRTDVSPIEKRIPLLVPIELCIWHGGQKSNYSGIGVPAPEEYYIQGYLKISVDNGERILQKYNWQDIEINISQMTKPASPSIADDFFYSPNIKVSEELKKEHTKTSSFSDGFILFNPDTNVFYFSLSNY